LDRDRGDVLLGGKKKGCRTAEVSSWGGGKKTEKKRRQGMLKSDRGDKERVGGGG